MEQDRDLSGATAIYRSTGYPGAGWYVMPDGDVVLQRPSGELDTTIMSPDSLTSAASRPTPVWYLETPAESEEDSAPPAEQG